MTLRNSRPHGSKEFEYHQRTLSDKGRGNYDTIFGKKDFLSTKIAPKHCPVEGCHDTGSRPYSRDDEGDADVIDDCAWCRDTPESVYNRNRANAVIE